LVTQFKKVRSLRQINKKFSVSTKMKQSLSQLPPFAKEDRYLAEARLSREAPATEMILLSYFTKNRDPVSDR
jgi:hypothetical protein